MVPLVRACRWAATNRTMSSSQSESVRSRRCAAPAPRSADAIAPRWAAAAAAANVPVSTIAFGTDTGTVEINGQVQRVPVDRQSLQKLADTTKGHYYEAASVGELKKVYQDMGSSIGYRTKPREITQWYLGLGLLFALGAAGMSLLWTSRLP